MRTRLSVICALLIGLSSACLAQDEAAPATPAPAVKPVDTAAAQPATQPKKPYHKPFFKRLFTVEAATATLPGAVVQQVHNWPDEWGKSRLGFEKRVASLYGQFVIGCMIEDGVHAVHKEDTTYRRLGHGNFFLRTAHVVVDTVTARAPDGHRTIAYSVPANAYGSWALATLWSPREYRTAASILEWGSAGIGTMAGTNFFHEFWPDFKSIFHHKKTAQP